MPTWIAAAIAVAAITATYFACIRPMRRGRRAINGTRGQNAGMRHAETDRQLAELREELRMLRAQDALDTGQVINTGQVPPSDR